MKISSVLLIIILLTASGTTLVTAASTTVQLIPGSKILQINETFVLTIKISPGTEVDTAGIDKMTWNKNVIDCLSVSQGNLFPEPLVWLPGRINNTAGKLEWQVIASNIPTTSTGTLCNITFKAKNPGISTISVETFGVARNGTDLPKHILNSCQVTVIDQYTPPNPPSGSENPGANTSTNTTQTNQTTNQTIPPDTPNNNNTYVPIDDPIINQNDTTPPIDNTNNNPPSNNEHSFFDNLPTTTIIYLVIAILLISVFAYILVRHLKNKQDEKEDNDVDDIDAFIEENFGGGTNGETDSGSEL